MSSTISVYIENPKGSYKSFEIENDPLWKDYPLAGVTYPVDYGYLDGYVSEDGCDLDVFIGSGDLYGYIRIWRCDVPVETKFVLEVTRQEWEEVMETFRPVLKKATLFFTKENCITELKRFKRPE